MDSQEWADQIDDEAKGVYAFAIMPLYEFIHNPATATACLTWVNEILVKSYVCCLLCGEKVGPEYRGPGAVTILQASDNATLGSISTICVECMSKHTFQEAFNLAFTITTEAFGMDDARLLDIHESTGHA